MYKNLEEKFRHAFKYDPSSVIFKEDKVVERCLIIAFMYYFWNRFGVMKSAEFNFSHNMLYCVFSYDKYKYMHRCWRKLFITNLFTAFTKQAYSVSLGLRMSIRMVRSLRICLLNLPRIMARELLILNSSYIIYITDKLLVLLWVIVIKERELNKFTWRIQIYRSQSITITSVGMAADWATSAKQTS